LHRTEELERLGIDGRVSPGRLLHRTAITPSNGIEETLMCPFAPLVQQADRIASRAASGCSVLRQTGKSG
jgi:hypothetical protein